MRLLLAVSLLCLAAVAGCSVSGEPACNGDELWVRVQNKSAEWVCDAKVTAVGADGEEDVLVVDHSQAIEGPVCAYHGGKGGAPFKVTVTWETEMVTATSDPPDQQVECAHLDVGLPAL